MKILITNNEPIDMKGGWRPELMPEKEGLYLANDGIADMILSVVNPQNKEVMPLAIYLPQSYALEDYKQREYATIDDLVERVSDNIKQTRLLRKAIENIQIPQSKETIDSDVLLKAIALSQKAELIKDI